MIYSNQRYPYWAHTHHTKSECEARSTVNIAQIVRISQHKNTRQRHRRWWWWWWRQHTSTITFIINVRQLKTVTVKGPRRTSGASKILDVFLAANSRSADVVLPSRSLSGTLQSALRCMAVVTSCAYGWAESRILVLPNAVLRSQV